MFIHDALVVSPLMLVLSAAPGLAGPCTTAIDQTQAQLDARIDAIAAVGPTGPESTGALLRHQPTPGSIAEAEQKLGEGKSLEKALTALKEARAADRAGDGRACEKALGEAQQAMKP
ncbi:hypothetical protein [Microvirga sp. 2TAF3]|uniref:hypothetical protein n=1 Tax=Microvirga sp. 2TAF3 TaxID=3233014 RepID=UPI003F9EAA86